jgi:hypothetical protein
MNLMIKSILLKNNNYIQIENLLKYIIKKEAIKNQAKIINKNYN